MANKFREKPIEEQPTPKPEEPKTPVAEESTEVSDMAEEPQSSEGNKRARTVAKVLGGDILADQMVLKQIPLLLLFLGCLLVVIANRYNVEKISRDKQDTEVRINFLREHRIQMQKQYQQSIKISQIAEDLQEMGVGITAGPPYEIEK